MQLLVCHLLRVLLLLDVLLADDSLPLRILRCSNIGVLLLVAASLLLILLPLQSLLFCLRQPMRLTSSLGSSTEQLSRKMFPKKSSTVEV